MGDVHARDLNRGQPSTYLPSVIAALVGAVTTLAVVGCSSIGPTTAASKAPATTEAAPTTVPPDIQQVCTRFLSIALSVDTTTDRGPADARMRAARAYGAPQLATRLQGQGRDPDWSLLVAHRAHVRVATQPVVDDPPPIRGDEAAAGVHVTRIAVGADSWRQRLSDTVAYCSLGHGPDGWKVTDLTFSDSPTSGAGR